MMRLSAWLAAVAMMCLPVAAQDKGRDPPAPAIDGTPKTYVENASPTTFGAAVVTGTEGRLVVGEVTPASRAALAGLSARDQIVSINGTPITEPARFEEFVAAHPADPLQVIVMRDGVQKTIVINPPAAAASTSRPAIGVRFLQGPSVLIGEVIPGSPAASAGLLMGDQVIAVNNTPITSSDHFISLIAAAPLHSKLELTYLRGGARATASFEPGTWDTVFNTPDQYVTLKPTTEVITPTAAPAGFWPSAYYPATYYPPSYFAAAPYTYAYVSAVGVPGIAFPTYYGFPYGYTYLASPYYYSGYYVYPNWYPYTWPVMLRSAGPFPGHPGQPKARTESAATSAQPSDSRIVEQFGVQ